MYKLKELIGKCLLKTGQAGFIMYDSCLLTDVEAGLYFDRINP